MAKLVAVNVSPGGIPKLPLERGEVRVTGLVGDGQAHAKHTKPSRALSLLETEVLDELREEGYAVGPGMLGENLTLEGLDRSRLAVGRQLRFSGGVTIELTEARKPCFILDKVDPRLKTVTVGRIGWMASVVVPGTLSPGEAVELVP